MVNFGCGIFPGNTAHGKEIFPEKTDISGKNGYFREKPRLTAPGIRNRRTKMLTSRQRADLRAAANKLPAIFQVGKNGIEENLLKQVDDALEARELIKLRILDTADVTPKETANELAAATGADVVQVVGRVIVLWRKSEEKR